MKQVVQCKLHGQQLAGNECPVCFAAICNSLEQMKSAGQQAAVMIEGLFSEGHLRGKALHKIAESDCACPPVALMKGGKEKAHADSCHVTIAMAALAVTTGGKIDAVGQNIMKARIAAGLPPEPGSTPTNGDTRKPIHPGVSRGGIILPGGR